MPYAILKTGKGYSVINKDTGRVFAKHTTKQKAEAQVRLLHSKEKKST
jgi:hypothetical protein